MNEADPVGGTAAGMIGYELYLLGRAEDAEPLLRRVWAVYPSALRALCHLLASTNRFAEAREILRAAELNGVEGVDSAFEAIKRMEPL